MRHLERLRHFFRGVFRGRLVERELGDEAEDWVRRLADRHQARGLSPEEARRAALVELGGLEQMKEEARALRTSPGLASTMQDIRYAWRALKRAPGFTVAALLTFGLGIGATTAIFSVVKATLLEPLPYRRADRLLLVWADLTDLGYPHAPLAGPELAEFQTKTTKFDGFGGVWATTAALSGDGDAEQLRIATVTSDFFTLLGVEPELGRVIGPEHFRQPVLPVLLSYALWERRYGGDRTIVGRRIVMNDRPAIVIGVMPQRFKLLFPQDGAVPDDLQAWVPGGPKPAAEPRGQQYLRVVARMKPGVAVKAAADEIASVGAAMIRSEPGAYSPGSRFYGVSMQQDAVSSVKPVLIAMFTGVCILLVIACVNVAGLLLIRAAARRRETAVRIALGARRGRLVRQYLVEGLLLSTLGVGVGLALAVISLRVLVTLAPASLSRVAEATVDPGVLTFALLTASVWGVVFSLSPMTEVLRVTPEALQRDARGSAGAVPQRTRAVLVVVQVALGLVLLVSAGLLAKAFGQLLRIDPGFNGDSVMTFRVSVPFSRYRSLAAQNAFNRRLDAELRALPGVTAVGAVSHLPYDNLPNWAFPYLREGETDPARQGLADARTAAPGFFETLQARLVAGRFFAEDDATVPKELPVIVDDTMATRLWPGEDPIGRQFPIDPGGSGSFGLSARVIGVVSHLRHRSLTERGREQIFVPSRLVPRNPVAYLVRGTGNVDALAGPIRAAVKRLDPGLPVYDMKPLATYLAAARSANRFTLTLAATFAGVALLLSCVGVYGVIAYAVDRRRRDFGIRLALGARRSALVALVLREGLVLTGAGLVLGLVGAAVAAGLLRTQLYATTPYEPGVYAVAAAILASVSLLACVPPARRASGTRILSVLREE
jgi:predicted permease